MFTDGINWTSRYFYKRSLGLLLLRLVLGFIFLTHGWDKVEHIAQIEQFFGTLGFWPWIAYLIGWLEVIGGIALILGVATRLFGLLFGIEMLVAVFLLGPAHGFASVEFELLIAVASLAIALMGSGKFSIYRMECLDCGGMLCNGETGVCVPVDAD
jgi:putative oxidoreductase